MALTLCWLLQKDWMRKRRLLEKYERYEYLRSWHDGRKVINQPVMNIWNAFVWPSRAFLLLPLLSPFVFWKGDGLIR